MSDVPNERAELVELREVVQQLLADRVEAAAEIDELADALAAERQRLHDRIEAAVDHLQATQIIEWGDVKWVRLVTAHGLIRALASEASASSPVSDDTGGTK